MNNYKIYSLRGTILNVIGNAQVTPAEAYFVVSDVLNELKAVYLEQVNKEAEELRKKQEKENKEQTEEKTIVIDADKLPEGDFEVPLD